MKKPTIGTLLALPVSSAIAAICMAPLFILFVFSFYQVDFVNILREPTLKNYSIILLSETYRSLIGSAFFSGALVAFITAILGHPVAFFIAKRIQSAKSAFLVLLLVPLYTGDLVRIFAWRVVLGSEGAINRFLLWIGLIEEPIRALLFSPLAVHIVLIYNFLPFMVIGLWLAYENLDDQLIEVANDLGANRLSCFLRVTFPLTLPGLIAGSMMVFAMVVGDYLTPQLIGGASGITIISAINDLFGTAFDWPLGSAIAWTMLALISLFLSIAALAISKTRWVRAMGGLK